MFVNKSKRRKPDKEVRKLPKKTENGISYLK